MTTVPEPATEASAHMYKSACLALYILVSTQLGCLVSLPCSHSQRPVGERPATSAAALGGRAEMLGNSKVSTTSISALQTGMSASRMFAAPPVAGWIVTVAPVLLTCRAQELISAHAYAFALFHVHLLICFSS